jgi:hypothetical protein
MTAANNHSGTIIKDAIDIFQTSIDTYKNEQS